MRERIRIPNWGDRQWRTEVAICDRFVAGDSIASLAKDYGQPREVIENVLRAWHSSQRRTRERRAEPPLPPTWFCGSTFKGE